MPGAKRSREGGAGGSGGFFDSSAPSNGGYVSPLRALLAPRPRPSPRDPRGHARAVVRAFGPLVPRSRPAIPRSGPTLRTRTLCAPPQAPSPERGSASALRPRPRRDATVQGAAQRQRHWGLPRRRMATRLGRDFFSLIATALRQAQIRRPCCVQDTASRALALGGDPRAVNCQAYGAGKDGASGSEQQQQQQAAAWRGQTCAMSLRVGSQNPRGSGLRGDSERASEQQHLRRACTHARAPNTPDSARARARPVGRY